MQRHFLVRQIEEYRARVAALDGQEKQKQAEINTIAATISKLQADEPIIRTNVTPFTAASPTSNSDRSSPIFFNIPSSN